MAGATPRGRGAGVGADRRMQSTRQANDSGRLTTVGKLVWLVLLGTVTMGVAGCGGGSGHKPKHKISTTPLKRAVVPRPALPTVLTETVRGPASKDFLPSVNAKSGDMLVFKTYVPGRVTSPAETVSLSFAAGPGAKLTVTAKAHGETSRVTIDSPDHKPLTLQVLHYNCSLPPVPTFCPAQSVGSAHHRYLLRFSSTHRAAIFVSALVGPVKIPAAKVVASSGSSVVPPYAATEVVAVRPPATATSSSAKKPVPLAQLATARVKPGDSVILLTHLKGALLGAPQTVTVTIDQGPGTTLKMSASVPGGQSTPATIKSATGSPIALVLPHYSCSVPPARTFCPASQITAHSGRYMLKFLASPRTAGIVVIGTVQAG